MISSIKNLDSDFIVELELGNVCNFKCSYCFPGANTGDNLWPDPDRLANALLKYLKAHSRKTRLYILGGETTLWKHLPQFCNTLKMAHDVTISISTNASKSLRWWSNYWHCFDVVHISLHPEEADIKHTIEVADLLYEKDVETNIDILMSPDNFENCKKYVEQVKQSKNKFPIIAKTVLIDGAHKYNNEQIEYMKNPLKRIPDMTWYNRVKRKARTSMLVDGELIHNDNHFVLNDLNHFKGWMCHLGVDIVKIDHKGNVKGNCGQLVNQNIYTDNLFTITPVICEQDTCYCSGEMCATKWIPNGF